MEGGEKMSLRRFLADQIAISWKKNAFWGNKLLLVARHVLTTGLQTYL